MMIMELLRVVSGVYLLKIGFVTCFRAKEEEKKKKEEERQKKEEEMRQKEEEKVSLTKVEFRIDATLKFLIIKWKATEYICAGIIRGY